MTEEVLRERRGHVEILTINRPEARNAINRATAIALGDLNTRDRDYADLHQLITHHRLELSASGRRLLSDCNTRAAAVERSLTADLPAAEAQAIRRWLVRLATVEA